MAIGEEDGACELIENKRSVTSSLLRASARLDQEDLYQPLRKVVNVIRRLDTIAVEIGLKQIDLLKIDVQGYEQHVLNGLGELLTPTFVRAIFMELNFASFYDNQSDPGKIISYLSERGYKCYGIYEIHANYEDGITYLDALFLPAKVG